MQEEGGVERLVGGAAVRMTKMRRCSTSVEGKFPQDSDAGGRENPGSARGETFLLEFQSVRYLTGETRWAIGWWDCTLPCLVTA